jgi:acetyl esterase/lipase
MKVTNDMIREELRFAGKMTSFFSGNMTEKKFRSSQKLGSKLMRLLKVKDILVEKRWIPRSDGGQMRILILKPLTAKKDVPGVIWLHGGGYAIGAAEMALVTKAKQLVLECGAVVISPDYRLSVEAPYPAATNDCYNALLYMKNTAQELGIRSDQLFVGGESAGGGLAAALSIYARDKKEVSIAFQMPLYPMIDDRMETESARDNDAPVWNSVSNENAWKLYLGELYGKEVPPYAAAARETDYTGLPPAVTFVGDIEPFHDETVAYIENLRKAGVPAEIAIYPGCYHGFDLVSPKSDVGKQAGDFFITAYRYAAEHYFARQRM